MPLFGGSCTNGHYCHLVDHSQTMLQSNMHWGRQEVPKTRKKCQEKMGSILFTLEHINSNQN